VTALPFAFVRADCRRPGRIRRLLTVLRFRRRLRRGCDIWLEDPPADSFVREPRRPKPSSPSAAVALDLPD
jgi:hypothetical protein